MSPAVAALLLYVIPIGLIWLAIYIGFWISDRLRSSKAVESPRQRQWTLPDGGTLTLLSSDEELAMTPEQRWTKLNAEAKAAGCRCGKPATRVRYDHYNVGSVPVEFWTCDDHVGVNVWTNDGSGWKPA